MKIFFHAPITEKMKHLHDKYYNYISQSGHQNTSKFCQRLQNADLYDKEIRRQARDLFANIQQNIKNADVVILGATEQSVGVGFFLYIAIQFSKPIIALCLDYQKIPFVYDAVGYNKLIIRECNDKNFKTVIKESLEEATKLIDKRFTLLLPPDVVEMLEVQHVQTKQTRSEYIRDLIRKDQQKNQSSQP